MDENQQEENFEALLEQSEAGMLTRVSQGQKLKARVVHISGDHIHVDIGMRSEAVMEKTDDPRLSELQDGSILTVFVHKAGGEVQVGLDPLLGMGDVDLVLEAYENGNALEGTVLKTNRGGFEVNLAGVRCFCPLSQIDERRADDPQAFIGQKLPFRILECDGEARNPVVSHRVLQAEERERQLRQTWSCIHPEAVLKGKVREIKDFGAFVDLGGVLGLVHISELAYQRIDRVGDMLSEGDEIEVKVLSVEKDARGKDRISLSMKALLPDPWETVTFKSTELVKGRVVRKKPFGLFVSLQPGLEGLLPTRFLKRAGRNVDLDEFEMDAELEVQVVDFDREKRQVSLALPGWDEEVHSDLKPGDGVRVRVARIIPAGLLVDGVDDPARGLLPKRLLPKGHQRAMEQQYPVGKEMDAVVESIDERGRYAFMLRPEKEEVDPSVLNAFMHDDSTMKHNPFSAFFSKDDSD